MDKNNQNNATKLTKTLHTTKRNKEIENRGKGKGLLDSVNRKQEEKQTQVRVIDYDANSATTKTLDSIFTQCGDSRLRKHSKIIYKTNSDSNRLDKTNSDSVN